MKGLASRPVPETYRGVWQRSLLQTDSLTDSSSSVFWLQTACWHADIRMPAGRPDFSGVQRLNQCSSAQLHWLAQQQGFAGITLVDTSVVPAICRWQRLVDFQPPSLVPDAGSMEFEAGTLVERGVHADYLEYWHLLPDSSEGFSVFRKPERQGQLNAAPHYQMHAGRYVMEVRSHPACGPFDLSPETDLASLLDFEISFGVRSSSGWRITHSTLPWLEGCIRTLPDALADDEWEMLA